MADTEAEKSFEAFKIPQSVAQKDLFNSSNSESEPSVSAPENSDTTDIQKSELKNIKPKRTKSMIDVPLPYKEPSWSGAPPDLYSLEIIKNGAFLEMFSIKNSLVVFGRLDICDIMFEHPSVSRFHAVIQYCQGDSTHAQGFYLYDLGSTHGTFLNKEKITPKIYYKLEVGYILKFGGSTRLHIFNGPEEEEEKKVIEKPKLPLVEEICSWGISEDAEEEEEENMSENPFALSTPNEELYLDDPKKTLKGWFEREGYEVEYNVEEKGFKTFSCRIQLPIDTPTGDFMTVEASVSGKKKEAVIACALEACRTLDRLGLLRQSNQESRQRKRKKWEENDYYDSDEDTFLDRTGTIEKKREMRKRTEKKPEAETFESIESKYNAVTTEIEEINRKLSVAKNDVQGEKNAEDDSLEAYMSTLSETKDMASDKIERRKLKYRLVQAEKEKSHLKKLLEIVRPTKLPPAIKYPGMIGKRIKSKLPKISLEVKETVPIPKLNENEEEVEEDSDSEIANPTKVADASDSIADKSSTSLPVKTPSRSTVIGETSVSLSFKDKVEEDAEKKKAYGLILPISKKDSKTVSSGDVVTKVETDTAMPTLKEIRKSPVISVSKQDEVSVPKKRRRESKKKTEPNTDVYKTESAEYSTWVPPAGQTGDGITHLNSKYGY